MMYEAPIRTGGTVDQLNAGKLGNLVWVELSLVGMLFRRSPVVDNLVVGIGVAQKPELSRSKRLKSVGVLFGDVSGSLDLIIEYQETPLVARFWGRRY